MDAGLEKLRFPVSRSRGRRYPEPDHPYRTAFQRDRDRVIHTRAFRRMENKTQVFTPALSDHFRNRLTHTIEVSQIARTVAAVLELDPDLTEALALAHDIGHPPFAHAGEEELNRQMQRFHDHFDHNLHALRLVEAFELRYARFPGLNLTFEVREGMAKHSRDFGPGEHPELDEYLPGLRPPLEAQLIDLADEVAYNTADLDDGFSARLFSVEDICSAVPHYAAIAEGLEMQFPGAPDKVRFQEAVRRLIDVLVTGLIEGTATAAIQSQVQDVEDVRRYPERLVRFSDSTRQTNADLKRFLSRTVYCSPEIMLERQKREHQIAEMFDFFMQHSERLPEGYSEQAKIHPRHRVVCDYIAGMTDGFFSRTYSQLFG